MTRRCNDALNWQNMISKEFERLKFAVKTFTSMQIYARQTGDTFSFSRKRTAKKLQQTAPKVEVRRSKYATYCDPAANPQGRWLERRTMYFGLLCADMTNIFVCSAMSVFEDTTKQAAPMTENAEECIFDHPSVIFLMAFIGHGLDKMAAASISGGRA